MSHLGTILRTVFFPLKLITIPLGWLVRHRCAFEPNSNVCTSAWCAVGKRPQDGWRQWRAGEWVKTPKRSPLPYMVPSPPPSILRGKLADGRRVTVNVTVKITG